jgi:uncharacterized membrane protein
MSDAAKDVTKTVQRGRIARLWRGFRVRPRLTLSVLFGVLIYFALGLPDLGGVRLSPTTRFLIAWDSGTTVYLALALHLMARSDTTRMKRRAEIQDDGKGAILTFSILASVVSVVAIVGQLAAVPDLPDGQKVAHVALSAVTIPLAWLFMHTAFALHYAHDYYRTAAGSTPGLDIPDETKPDYFDFLYFSLIIGTAAQTADIAIRSKAMRRICTVHCTLAFFFNTTVLALTINIAASLIGK